MFARDVCAIVVLVFVAGCGDGRGPGAEEPADDVGVDAPGDVGATGTPRFVTHLDDAASIEAVSSGDLSVKFLAALDAARQPAPLDNLCVFQDMHDTSWHLEFLRGFPAFADLGFEAYLDLVLRRRSRQMWGGSVRLWLHAKHPDTGQPGLVSFAVYADEPQADQLTVADVVAVHARLSSCVGLPLVFVGVGPIQLALVRDEAAAFEAAGVVATDAATLAGEGVEVYSEGTGYGTLVIGDTPDYAPRDVLVRESAPNDIGVVAGLITSQPQNLHSHVNLRLGEKGIPNARLPGATTLPSIVALDGALVRIRATQEGVEVVAADIDEAQAWWDAHRPDVGQPSADLDKTELAVYSEPVPADAYGAKASNCAELYRAFGPDEAFAGFGIPFSAYREHVARNGIDAAVDAFLGDPRRHADPAWRRAALDDLRDAIRDGAVDPALLAAVESQVRAWLGPEAETTRLRFRSSTNVEDREALTGAGLYDSKSGCLGDDVDGDETGPSRCLSAEEARFLEARLAASRQELADHPDRSWLEARIADLEGDLTQEKPISRALPRVWRSLWNDRAWSERDYYGIDHRRAFMGIAVNPSFVLEQVNAVVITNLDPDGDAPLYRVVSQRAPESVVRPEDPSAIAEVRSVRRDGDALRDSTLWVESSLGADLWGDEAFARLMALVFRVHDHFSAQVYGDARLPFDLEVKLTADGVVVVKQIRPYVTEDP